MDTPEMTPLSKTLRVGGYDLREIARRGDVAIYEQSKGGAVLAYEVIRVQKLGAKEIYGRQYEPREGYPGNEQWGTQAWTCATLERAKERMAGIGG